MPSATFDKLNQLRAQLQECTNPTAAKLLKSTIAKLEAQLRSNKSKSKSSTIAQRKAEQQVRVLHPDQELEDGQETSLEEPVNQASEVLVNPIGALQEFCQKQRIALPRYEFEPISEGFRCTVLAMGLSATGDW